MSISDLKGDVENLLKDSGFPPEQYIINIHEHCIAVHFDLKEAVEYFRGDFEFSNLADKCVFDYKKYGRRHAAYIYFL